MNAIRTLGVLAGAAVIVISGCGGSVPELCGENVERVTALDFSGPSVIPKTTSFDPRFYTVRVTVDKTSPANAAVVCFMVRDDDPLWFDNVLTVGSLTVLAGANNSTASSEAFGLRAGTFTPFFGQTYWQA